MAVEHQTQAPDRELVIAVATGDEEAFEALRERYYPSVLSFLTALVGDAAAVEAAETTFASAHVKLRSAQPERFKSWLFAEAHRTGLAVNDRGEARRRPLSQPRHRRAWHTLGRHRPSGPDR